MPEQSRCKSCGAMMRWVTSENDKAVPLDAEPVADGNIVLVDGLAHFLKKGETSSMFGDGKRYKSHFATCEFASQYRKKA